jgi:predicted DNA-binding transcriptional regulator AlpA
VSAPQGGQSRDVLTEAEVASWLGISRDALRGRRRRGTGPPYIRFGRTIRYPREDLERWRAAGWREK